VVQVLLFAGLREQAGWSSREVALTGTTLTPLTVWGRLELGAGGPASPSKATTAAAPQPPGIRVAINHQFAGWEAPLRGGDELAFLPPITGG
jgi:molybdopterin synthase sulfur carrier subunit